MNVWIQNPFDNLPVEGYRKQRFWLMAEAFARAGHRVTLWTSDFNHMTKGLRALRGLRGLRGLSGERVAKGTYEVDGLSSKVLVQSLTSNVSRPVLAPSPGLELRLMPTRPYRKNVGLERVRSHREYARTWERLARELVAESNAETPNLIIASTPTVSGAETAVRLARTFGAKVAVDVMDAWPETFERLAPKGLRWLARLALTGLRRRAQRVYLAADFVSGVCERYRALTGRSDYYLAYHGIELEDGRRKTEDVGRKTEGGRLVYAGNLGRTYDLGTVIRGLKELNARLDVAGRGQGEAEWQALVKELGLENRVTFHGYLGEGELARLLASADIGLVPMPSESFVGVPYKFADYAAAGLAIVSSLGGESADLLARYRCGAGYAPGDVSSFVAAVRRVQAEGAGDVEGLRRLFDARRIYDAYVEWVTK